MSSKLAASLLVATLVAAQNWQQALPGYKYNFPHDHFNHPDYATEWWYYTGNLRSADGHRYGYELTFFRQAVKLPADVEPDNKVWRPDELYLAHFALSDIDKQTFFHTERLNRAGPGLAGADVDGPAYWNGNWKVKWTSSAGAQTLEAVAQDFTLKLDLSPAKPFVIHGLDGVSQKGVALGEASHYISFTRLESRGTLTRDGKDTAITGLSWMDHEFFTETIDETLSGWDWFAIQLNNGEDLMLYRLRTKAGGVSPYSSGTFVDAKGNAHHLASGDFTLSPSGLWESGQSKGRYPLAWSIAVPSLGISLQETTLLKKQELYLGGSVSPAYWEGAVNYEGRAHDKPASGSGYLEMTGYAAPIRFGH
jgi:predicted secreted hydrolase